ncbi:hypothetical protein ACWDOP_01625 [Nocardia sp. NPDC003693]
MQQLRRDKLGDDYRQLFDAVGRLDQGSFDMSTCVTNIDISPLIEDCREALATSDQDIDTAWTSMVKIRFASLAAGSVRDYLGHCRAFRTKFLMVWERVDAELPRYNFPDDPITKEAFESYLTATTDAGSQGCRRSSG